MPVGMLQSLQGVTKQQYDQVNEKMFGQSPPSTDQLPDGLIVHSAGPAENGWYIYDIWETRDDFQRVNDGQMGAAGRAVFGHQPPPSRPEPTSSRAPRPRLPPHRGPAAA